MRRGKKKEEEVLPKRKRLGLYGHLLRPDLAQFLLDIALFPIN